MVLDHSFDVIININLSCIGQVFDDTVGGSPIKIAFSTFSIQADIVACALDASSGGHHLLGALPTGFGKSLPMMVLATLLPPGITIK